MVELDSPQETLATHYLPGERAEPGQLESLADRLSRVGTLGDLLEVVPGPVLILNEYRQIVAANRRLLSDLGLERLSDLLGRRPGEALHCVAVPESPSGCGTSERCAYCGLVNTVVECARSKSAASGECRIRTCDGTALEWQVTATFYSIGGDPVVIVGLQDIAGQKRRELLERAFFHDVLNTAGGIRGLLSIVEESADDEERKAFRGNLVALADDLIDEIRSHRELVTAESGDLEVRAVRVPIAGLLRRLRSLYAGHAVAKGREILLESHPTGTVRTDETLLRRILGNMLKNALEATPIGGTVRICARIDGSDLTIEVGNPGVMSPEVRQQVFQRSFSTKGRGRGIGTYSMKLLGERYLGGEVTFDSDGPGGTRFRIRLPGAAETDTSHPEAAANHPDLDGRRVLVADDSGVNRLVVRRRLESLGCFVTEAADGREALAALPGSASDVVLLDLEMPVMGGLEVARRIRESETGSDRRLRIIALTGSAGREDRARCHAAGMDAVLEKPVRLEDLERAVAP